MTDANLGETSYGYDGNGNRTTVTDAKNNLTKYDYNEFNLLSKVTNPLNQVIRLEYDKNGNTKKQIFPKGDTVSFTYNALNRMDGIYHNGVKQWGLSYDANGNIAWYADNTGKTTNFTYDKNNRLTQESKGSVKTEYGYDPNDNLTSTKFTAGSTNVSTEFAYNKLDQLVALSRNNQNIAKYVYDERGNVTSVRRANNAYTAFQYNDSNLLSEVKNYKKDGTVLDSYKYSYDPNSNQTSVVTNNGTASYEYNALDQLTKETLIDGTVISYEYDKVGNRTKKSKQREQQPRRSIRIMLVTN